MRPITAVYVLLNRWVNPSTDWTDTNAVNLIIADWLTLATNVMNHPAVLGYLIGNEVNMQGTNRFNPAFWAALNRVAGAIRQYDTNHLISTANADVDTAWTIGMFNATVTNFNVWCIQAYRGSSFYGLFTDYAAASGKPLLITEFGLDAYDARISAEYTNNASLQASYVVSLWNELTANASVASGGFVFEWADEWWKTVGSPSVHDPGGWASGAFPDGWADEEWWGIHRVSPGSGGAADVLQGRAVFDQLRALWTARLSVTCTPPAQAQIVAQGAAGQTGVLQSTTNLLDWTAILTNAVPFTNTVTGQPQQTLFRVELR